jgi:hypothetical protein
MASVLPRSRQELINWCLERVASWAAAPASIGLSAPQVAAMASQLSAAQNAEDVALANRIAAKNSTLIYYTETDALRELVAGLTAAIKAYALTTDDPTVYAKASIPAPSPGAPLGPPPIPTNLSSTLLNSGNIEIRFDGTRRGGTSFRIYRALTPPGGVTSPFSLIGTSEERVFIDTAVPIGQSSIAYRVEAGRAGGFSEPSDPTIVYFGASGQQTQSGEGLTLAA